MKKKRTKTQPIGVALMLSASLLTCVGQLCWKLSVSGTVWLLSAGFALYGGGAMLMIAALRFGELSVLHPMLSAGYVLSIFLGGAVLGESVTALKAAGVAVIILGLALLSAPEKKERKS